MSLSGWQRLAVVAVLVGALACAMPGAEPPPLTAAAAQETLDGWNPSYCKLKEFYGFYQPAPGNTRVAYVLLTNPGDPAAKPMVYEARFQLLTRTDGQPQWFLTSLLNHAGGLTRRQGWDYLLLPVRAKAEAAGK